MRVTARLARYTYQLCEFMTVAEVSKHVSLDYLTGRVLFVGKDRKAKTLERFLNQLKPRQR